MTVDRRWVWAHEHDRAWWLGDDPVRIVEWQGDRSRVLVELAVAAVGGLALVEDALIVAGERSLWQVSLASAAITEIELSDPPGLDARIVGIGARRIAWVRPGGSTVHLADLDHRLSCELWPLESRVAHHAPDLGVDHRARKLAWCHVAGAVDLVDLQQGGFPIALGERPAFDAPTQAAVLPPEFAHGLWFDDSGETLAIASADDQGVHVRLGDHRGRWFQRIELGPTGRVLAVSIERGEVVLVRERRVEQRSFEGRSRVIVDRVAVAARWWADRVQLFDDQGLAWLEPGSAP